MTTPPQLRYAINLLPDGSVVNRDGEYLGTWAIDETDSIYEFTPDGEAEPQVRDVYIPGLCERIEEYLAKR